LRPAAAVQVAILGSPVRDGILQDDHRGRRASFRQRQSDRCLQLLAFLGKVQKEARPMKCSYETWTDEQLLIAFQESGERTLLDVLYTRYLGALKRIAQKALLGTPNRDDVLEELAEAPFIKLQRQRKTLAGFDPMRWQFRVFLLELLKDEIRLYFRRVQSKKVLRMVTLLGDEAFKLVQRRASSRPILTNSDRVLKVPHEDTGTRSCWVCRCSTAKSRSTPPTFAN
jgi:hypothetical protein